MARKTKQQAQETRQHILDAALQMFSERGVSTTSLADIAHAAGVTRGAIYWHFKNKTELFSAIWGQSESKVHNIAKEYRAKYPDNPLYVLREMLIYMLRSTQADRQWRLMMEVLFHKCEFVGDILSSYNVRKEFYHLGYTCIEEDLTRCVDYEQLPADMHIRHAAVTLRAYFTGVMENWLFMPDSFDIYASAPALVDAFLDMLRLSPALRSAAV
ncbi:multidrug efflux transporter transcriptional repressor AcrR [Affinibrenneria salicis]|uniref:Multidrug efflux transporter transcriptional repressor AcrR n=1 Tax=Affinibrenneria salicis TaxID=2590031 RepID=A0A5J5G0G8_9GAMM|nr:multidrug efflux transporter transcriptional repressor AcrR [Affinibrenneria salicis]KAA9000042.1 multidrug efflux transporter transcriptional repressor AcrR [Affinibrenneria salicis]